MRWWMRLGALIVIMASAGCGKPAQASPAPVPGVTLAPTPSPTPLVVAGVPEDVPLMPGAYDVQVQKAGSLVVYRVKALLGDVLAYYRGALPRYGWHKASASADRVVGYVAILGRSKDDGRRLLLNMRYDVAGGFVTVSISIARP